MGQKMNLIIKFKLNQPGERFTSHVLNYPSYNLKFGKIETGYVIGIMGVKLKPKPGGQGYIYIMD